MQAIRVGRSGFDEYRRTEEQANEQNQTSIHHRNLSQHHNNSLQRYVVQVLTFVWCVADLRLCALSLLRKIFFFGYFFFGTHARST